MTERKPCRETCGEDELGACNGEPSYPDYRPGKPNWRPVNPWTARNHVVRTETWEQGSRAMARALIARMRDGLQRAERIPRTDDVGMLIWMEDELRVIERECGL